LESPTSTPQDKDRESNETIENLQSDDIEPKKTSGIEDYGNDFKLLLKV
jgi:hypothetical protein